MGRKQEWHFIFYHQLHKCSKFIFILNTNTWQQKMFNTLDEYLSKLISIKQNLSNNIYWMGTILNIYVSSFKFQNNPLKQDITISIVRDEESYMIKDGNQDTSDSKVYVLKYSVYSSMISQITHISEFFQNESTIKNNRLYSRIHN